MDGAGPGEGPGRGPAPPPVPTRFLPGAVGHSGSVPARRQLLRAGLLVVGGGLVTGTLVRSGGPGPAPTPAAPGPIPTPTPGPTRSPGTRALAALAARSRAAGIPVGTTGYEHVGVPPGTSLTRVEGDWTSSADGEVLEFVDLVGRVSVNHRDVTIRYCRIRSTGDPKIRVNSSRRPGASLHLHDCQVGGTSDTDHGTAVGYGNYRAERVHVTRCEDAFRLGVNSTVATCLADAQSVARLPDDTRVHTDGVQSTGADNDDGVWSTVRDSTFLAVRSDGSKGNAAVIIGSEGARVDGVNQGTPVRNVLVEGNFFANGSYSVMQKSPENERGAMADIVFRDNVYAGDGLYGDICAPRWAVGEYVTFTGERRTDGSPARMSYWEDSAAAPGWYRG